MTGRPIDPDDAPDSFEEMTVERFHAGLRAGTLTSVDLVRWYLARIEALDAAGPRLNSVVTVNPAALAAAADLDETFARTGDLVGPLHGVPVLVKDQASTAGLRTTFGSRAFRDFVPTQDAAVVERLRAAGAIVLAKTTMCDLAAGWFSSSSHTGHTRCPFALDRDSGGSSAGTGAGVSANLGLLGVGEDTGGSIRIPASFNALVGLRVTTGLVSRYGFSPLVHYQDTPGPMARTVADVARLLDVLVGWDPRDPFTAAAAIGGAAGRYADAVADPTGMGAFRAGVLETAFGDEDDPRSGPVTATVRQALDRLADQGAQLHTGLEIDDLAGWIGRTSVYVRQSRADLTRFFASRTGGSPVGSFDELYRAGDFHPENDLFHGIAGGPDDPDGDAEVLGRREAQAAFQRLVVNLMARADVDVLIYPTVQVVPPTHRELADGLYTALSFPTNTVIASQAGLPAASVPVGFTSDGLPVGLEIVGRPFAERTVLRFAAAVERATAVRRAPVLHG